MPLRGILNTARALAYYERLQEITANNLANVSTNGYKADRMGGMMLGDRQFPVPVTAVDLSPGAYRDTGRPLDLALEGEGFFVVRTENGDRLTRGGAMRLDADGALLDYHGDPVMGEQGPITVIGQSVEIAKDGTVMVDGARIDKLRVVTVPNRDSLRKEGVGWFILIGTVTGAPGTVVRQGVLEESNQDSVTGMVDLVTIQRAYAANMDALKALDSVLGTVANEIGKV